MEWVVDTGRHQYVAISSHVPATATEQSMPYMYISWASLNKLRLAISLATVLVVSPPNTIAPRNSKMPAICMETSNISRYHACC